MTNLRKSALAVAIASSLALVGCGGGGGGGGGSTPPSQSGGDSGQQTSVSGSAIKGPLQNAEVRVIEVDNDGSELRTVAETQTDENGDYSVKLGDDYEGGLLKIVVRADDDTTMICDAPAGCGDVGFGGRIEQGLEGLELKAYSEKSEGSDDVETSVSTWSTLAADRADELNGATGDLRQASQLANSDVSGLVGFDIAKTRARSLTDSSESSADEAISAVLNAAAAELVFGEGSTESLAEKLNALTSSLKEDLKQGSEATAGESPVSRLVQAARNVADSGKGALNKDAKNAISNLDDDYEAATDEDLILAPGATPDDKIAKFKNFVTATRSWIQSIEDLNSDELTAAIDLDVTAAENALRGIQEGQLQFVVSAINTALDNLVENPTLIDDGGEQAFELVDEESAQVGSGTLTVESQAGIVMSIKGSVNNSEGASIPFDLSVDTNISPDAVDANAGMLKRIAASTDLVVSGQVGSAGSGSLTLNEVALNLVLANAVNSDVNGDFAEEEVFSQFQSASISGDIEAIAETGDRFSGVISAEVVRLEQSGRLAPGTNMEPFSLKSAGVDGDFVGASGNTFSTELRFNLNNAANFDVLAWSEYSNNDVDVSVPVSYGELSLVAAEWVDDESYWTTINVWPAYQDYYSEDPNGYELAVSNYALSGDVTFLTRYLPAAEVTDAVSEIRGYLEASFLTDEVEFRYQDPVTGETKAFTRKVTDLMNGEMWINGPNGSAGSNGASLEGLGPNEKAIGVRVYLTEDQLGEASGAYLAVSSEDLLPGIRVQGLMDREGSKQRFRFFIIRDTEVRPTSRTADRIAALYPEQARYASLFEFGEGYGGQGYVTYAIDSNEENLVLCSQDPEAFVGTAPQEFCFYNLLINTSYEQVALEGEALEQVETLRDRALVQRFGTDLVSRLVIEDFWISSESQRSGTSESRLESGVAYVNATFPDLESEQRFADVSMTLSANLNLQDLPAAKATVTVNRNSYLGGDLLANVRWDGGNYSVAMQTDDIENPNSYAGRIFNTQGYELTVNVTVDEAGDISAVSGDALLNGEDIGDLELRDNGMVLLVFPNGDSNDIVSLL